MTDDDGYKCFAAYGHVEVRAWLELSADGTRLIGMGQRTTRDNEGRIVSQEISPTGVELEL